MSNLRLKDFLAENSISQTELAEKVGMPPQNIYRIIKNDETKVSTLIKIAQALGVPASKLIDGSCDDEELTAHKESLLKIIQDQQATIKNLSETLKAVTNKNALL